MESFHNFQIQGVKDIDFWVDFVLKIQTNCKTIVWRENQLTLHCVHIAEFNNFQFWKCEN
jgi:hypothetical protein